MSKRPIQDKKLAKLTRVLTKDLLPAQIDLVEFLKLRYRLTSGTARQWLKDGRVRVDSHKLGTQGDFYAPADLRSRIEVFPPEDYRGRRT